VSGGASTTKIAEQYARMKARSVLLGPAVHDIYNGHLAFAQAPEPGILSVAPFAPLNQQTREANS
jgi:hypothetical protein